MSDKSSSLPLVSVIVPTYNSAAYLEGCLRSIKKQEYENLELIVVDNNSEDSTKEIAKIYADRVLNKGPERSAQRNFGVENSSGDYVLIVDSDMELSSKVVSEGVRKFTSNKNIKALVIPEESFGIGFWAQCKKLERSFYVGLEWMEAARFFTRKVFQEFKGYDEENTGTEDYDLPQRVENIYGKESISRINEFIYHNEQQISLLKTCKKKFYYAGKLEKYKSVEANKGSYNKQSNPIQRYKLFFSKPLFLIKNPLIGLGLIIMKTCEFTAGGLGYLYAK